MKITPEEARSLMVHNIEAEMTDIYAGIRRQASMGRDDINLFDLKMLSNMPMLTAIIARLREEGYAVTYYSGNDMRGDDAGSINISWRAKNV